MSLVRVRRLHYRVALGISVELERGVRVTVGRGPASQQARRAVLQTRISSRAAAQTRGRGSHAATITEKSTATPSSRHLLSPLLRLQFLSQLGVQSRIVAPLVDHFFDGVVAAGQEGFRVYRARDHPSFV